MEAMRVSLASVLLAMVVLAGSVRAEGAATGLELIGTWHVLVHYRDDTSANPDLVRWDDRIWTFERKGSRLQWSEFPLVVFRDSTGRFEALGTNRARRILHGWEPNAAQLQQIREGLEINSRGSKAKTLRGSREKGYASVGGLRSQSASVIGYHEHWYIEDLAGGNPLFGRDDILGSARAEAMEGRTQYRTTEVDASGDVIRGNYERDGVRHGTFRMTRAGTVASVGTKRTQSERLEQHFFGGLSLGGGGGELEELQEKAKQGELSAAERSALRREIHVVLEGFVRQQGGSPARRHDDIDRLAREVERLLVDEGKSLDEVTQMFRSGRLR